MTIVRRGALALLCVYFSMACGSINAKDNSDSAKLDEQDRQEFMLRVGRANACTQARDFTCAELQLGKAKSYANGSRDRQVLQKAMDSLELQRQLALRDNVKRQYAGESEAVEIQAENTERELAISRQREIETSRESLRQSERRRESLLQAERKREASQPQSSVMDEINKNTAKNLAILDSINQQTKDAYAETNRRLDSQAEDKKRARAASDEREASRKRDSARDKEANVARVDTQRERERRIEETQSRERELQRKMDAEKQARDLEQSRMKAEAEVAKRTEQKSIEQASAQYLRGVASGTRLVATKCPGGEGKYYASGSRPKIKPEVVGCVDMTFRAYCPGSMQYSEGTAHNFVGMSGCFGDTYEIAPKPNCEANQVRIEIVNARACSR